MPGPKRGKIFFEAASIMRNRAEEAASLMVNEMGKPIREARGEIGFCDCWYRIIMQILKIFCFVRNY